MRIVYEIDRLSTSGGIERIITEKANFLANILGWEVYIIVIYDESHLTAYPLSDKVRLIRLNIKTKYAPKRNILPKLFFGTLLTVNILYSLNKSVKELHPDIYVTFQTMGALSCRFRTHKVKTVYESHSVLSTMKHKGILLRSVRKADKIIVLTEKDAINYLKTSSTAIIPNFTTLTPQKDTDYSLKHCLLIGRFNHEKNIQRAIRVWHKLSLQNPDWILDIYGDGEEREDIENLITELNMHHSIVLHGKVRDMKRVYESASMLLVTSRSEGFCMALVEAMIFGLPCIAFDCDYGPREIIKDGENGYLIAYDDDDKFVEKASELMSSINLRESLGRQAKASSQRYSCEKVMAEWERLFTSLVEKRKDSHTV